MWLGSPYVPDLPAAIDEYIAYQRSNLSGSFRPRALATVPAEVVAFILLHGKNMKTSEISALSAIVLATSFITAPNTANAALVCTAGNVIGPGTCLETVTFGPLATDFSNAVLILDRFTNGALPGFMETLTSVNISFGGMASATGTLTNNAPSAQTFSFLETESLSFAAGPGAPPAIISATTSGNLIALGPITLAPGASRAIAGSLSLPPTAFSTSNLSGFTGAGTFQILASSSTNESFIGGGGNIQQVISTIATPSVTLTYNFDTSAIPPIPPVPEPSIMASLAIGLAGLGAFGRRRKARRS